MKVLDAFAGAGGWSEGARQAGATVVMAVNHWQRAVDSHAANHPETEHRCQDLAIADPRDFPRHDLFVASPACQGHTRARGKERPHHDAQRATAWCVINIAETCHANDLVVENVPDFRTWALYPLWLAALKKLGYHVTENVLDAADFGVPQNRERLFIVASLKKKPRHLSVPMLEHVPASTFVDFGPGKWNPIDKPGRALATLARIENGRKALGSRFLAPFYGSGSGLTGRSLDRPIGTITTLDRYAVIDGDQMRLLSITEAKAAMSFPAGYQLLGSRVEQLKQLGNAVCPTQARDVVRQIMEAA